MFVSGVMINKSEVLATQATFNVVVQNINLTTTVDLSCDVATWFVNCSTTDNLNIDDSTNFSTIETNSFNWTIEGFEEYTTYNCTFQPQNDSVNVITIEFTTSETGRCNCPIVRHIAIDYIFYLAPSMPTDFYANDVTATSFNLTWSEPDKGRNLLGYNLTITRTGVVNERHYWSGCEGDPETTKSVCVNNETFYYEFKEALPAFNYDVDIAAWYTAGLGDSNNLSLSTEVSGKQILLV